MEITYKFTGFMPSGNPFLWYYDDEQKVAFTTSNSVKSWDKEPKIGDTITMHASGSYNEITDKVFINGEQVYERTDEKEQEIKNSYSELYDNIKKEKGLTQTNKT